MGKFSELDTAIRDLRTAAETINEVANTLAELFSQTTDHSSATVEPETKALTLDDVSRVLMSITRMSKEHSQKLRALIQKYGANKLSDVDPKHYEAIIAEAEEIRNAR